VSALLEVAERFRAAGISIVPTFGPDKLPAFDLLPKGPDGKPTWAPFQQAIADTPTLHQWFGNGTDVDLAIVGGAVSGQLCVIDFDNERFYHAWLHMVGDLANGLYHEKTRRGYHVAFRCPNVGGNLKLAWVPDETEVTGRSAAIETRGQGGYCRVAPSAGCSVIAGDLAALPNLSHMHADALLNAARQLDEAPYTRQELAAQTKREAAAKPRPTPREGASVIDVYNRAYSIESVLTEHGYRIKDDRAVRPGGSSLSVKIKDGRSFHHSANDPLSNGYWHRPFDVFCQIEHGSDVKSAVKAAAALLGIARAPSPNGHVPAEPQWAEPKYEDTEPATVHSAPASEPSWPEPLAPEAFVGLAGDVVNGVAPHTEADPAALLLTFLVMAGNAIGRTPYASVGTTRHYLNLDVALNGETSKARKGTSYSPIRELFDRVDPAWTREHVMGGLSSGEGLIWAVRDPIYRTVALKDNGRPTGESMQELVDEGIRDKRLMVVEPELASVLKVMAREGNTLSPVVRQAWDDGFLRSMVKNAPAKATEAHVSILGHITKAELLRYLNDTEMANGFANRFLWVCTKRAQVLPEGGGLPDYDRLVPRLQAMLLQARQIGEVARDDESKALWADVYPGLSEGRPGLQGAVTARAEAQALRLMALYAVLDGSTVIRKQHLFAALAVWDYCAASAAYIFGDALGDPVADQIFQALRQAPDGLTRTAISNLLGRNLPASRIVLALALLARAGWARPEPQETGGRNAERWYAR
jgi:hypothetical protein